MAQWLILYRHEMLYRWRNKQIVWLPLVMAIIAILDMLTYYYLPEVIELSGGLPEGAVFEVPSIEPYEAIIMGLDQLSLIGTLIIVAIAMGTIASERKSGVAEIMLTKPIHPFYYITAKWFSLVSVTVFSLFIALLLNWYYTTILYGDISFHLFLQVFLFYSLWFVCILSLTMVWNAFSAKPGLVFSLSAIVLFLSFLIQTGFGHKLPYFPLQLTGHLEELLITESISEALVITSIILAGISLIFIIVATIIFERKQL
ncbi:MAG TPA: ABC transporter permease [Pseudogracilibacillus sp.]|nr:ABC transporter permease [Pseudogracilibacillus sp.]